MNNEEFQKRILDELSSVNNRLTDELSSINSRLTDELSSINSRLTDELSSINNRITDELSSVRNEFREQFNQLKIRQDEIYDVVRAIEHSNQIGRSELDGQNIRLSKLGGKFERVAKAYNDEIDMDKALNL